MVGITRRCRQVIKRGHFTARVALRRMHELECRCADESYGTVLTTVSEFELRRRTHSLSSLECFCDILHWYQRDGETVRFGQ